MARSQEALLKRAEKRAVPVEEQRQKDKKRKKTAKEDEEDQTTKVKKVSADDWTCKECTYSNYGSRSECKKCKSNKNGIKLVSINSNIVVPLVVAAPTLPDGKWNCMKCNNINFAVRTECNRCMEPRVSIKTSSNTTVAVTETSKVTTKRTPSKPIVVGNAVVKHKKYEWGRQASEEKIEENKLLLEIIQSGADSAVGQLSSEEAERAKILLARKGRKEAKKAKIAKSKEFMAKKKSKAKAAANSAAKATAAVVKPDSSAAAALV
jgi:uncharacterized OB-fold protein